MREMRRELTQKFGGHKKFCNAFLGWMNGLEYQSKLLLEALTDGAGTVEDMKDEEKLKQLLQEFFDKDNK